jgi:hypothetical protein
VIDQGLACTGAAHRPDTCTWRKCRCVLREAQGNPELTDYEGHRSDIHSARAVQYDHIRCQIKAKNTIYGVVTSAIERSIYFGRSLTATGITRSSIASAQRLLRMVEPDKLYKSEFIRVKDSRHDGPRVLNLSCFVQTCQVLGLGWNNPASVTIHCTGTSCSPHGRWSSSSALKTTPRLMPVKSHRKRSK